jgi:hypothetical protein
MNDEFENDFHDVDDQEYSEGLRELDNSFSNKRYHFRKANEEENHYLTIIVRTYSRKDSPSESIVNPNLKSSQINRIRVLEGEGKLYFVRVVVLAILEDDTSLIGSSFRPKELFEIDTFSQGLRGVVERHNMIENAVQNLKVKMREKNLIK